MISLLKKYNSALQDIYAHVGFKEDWVVCPIDDLSECYWRLSGNPAIDVIYGDKKDVEEENGEHYSAEIYTQRFYNKWIYEGELFTMIFIDTHTDGMKYFAVFDNSKKL